MLLEFMKNENPSLLGKIRDYYMHRILPKVGGFISKNLEAYEYLPNSIEGFLTVKKMQEELDAAGFDMLFTKSSCPFFKLAFGKCFGNFSRYFSGIL